MSRKQLKSIETCGRLQSQRFGQHGDPTRRRRCLPPPARRRPAARRADRPTIARRPAGSARRGDVTATADERASMPRRLRAQRIELPSWAFGNSGTRFKVFAQQGVPARPVREDRRRGRRSTATPASRRRSRSTSRGTRSTTTRASPATPRDLGVALGTINSNMFQDDDYMLGSVCHPDARVRRKAVDHLLECIDIMDATGSRDLKLWFADGTNYPGQDDIRARQDRLAEALADRLRPARAGPADACSSTSSSSRRSTRRTCPTGAPRSSTASRSATGEGRRRHRPPRPGHEHRVHRRVAAPRSDRLGGFDFNSRFYADDDLMVGAADPFQLFRIMHEVVQRRRASTRRRASRSCSTSATTSSRRSRARSGP